MLGSVSSRCLCDPNRAYEFFRSPCHTRSEGMQLKGMLTLSSKR